MKHAARPRTTAAVAALIVASLALTACGNDAGDESAEKKPGSPAARIQDPIVTTYDGGLYVLDGATLKLAKDIPLAGFNRVNPAGSERHVMVSTATGFQVLDAVGGKLTDVEFEGSKPGHVVRHAGRTVLFSDGTGVVTVLDPKDLGDTKPKTETYTSAAPHHGVAIQLADGTLVTTLGTEEKRVGITVLGKDRKEITRSEECPGVHGEATAQGEAVVIGCEDGVLIYKDGAAKKVKSPTDYGRIGNQAAPTSRRSSSATTRRTRTPSWSAPSRCPSSTPGPARCGWSTSARATPSAPWRAARTGRLSSWAPTAAST